jgi:ribose transport system ATP-binding protein
VSHPDGDPAALEVVGVSKYFGPTRVLDRVSFAVRPGEIHALVGENGSGKSTLLKILSGFYPAEPGARMVLEGQEVPPGDGALAAAGVRFVHQELGLVHSLNAIDNIALGSGYAASPRRAIRWRAEAERTAALLRRLGHDIDVRRPVGELRMSEQTAVAIARALAGPAPVKVLALDEPTANLPVDETSQLLGLLRRLRAGGTAIVLVSHHFDEVLGLADTVTVLRDGVHVETRPVRGLSHDHLVELMLGHALEKTAHARRTLPSADPVLDASGVSGVTVRKLDVDVSAGEIVGIAGVTGSGREEVVELIAGGAARAGVVRVNGDELPPGRPDLALAAGVGIVPSSRATRAIVGGTVRENLVLTDLRRCVRRGAIRMRIERADVESWLNKLDIRGGVDTPLLNLSGGNQQKVILSRCLRTGPRLMLLDQPTQGVDIGAKEMIYRIVDDAASSGTAILLASTDTEELVRMCDRVIVLSGGRVTVSLAGPQVERTAITRALNQPRAAQHVV